MGQVEELESLLSQGSARPWHMDIKNRMSSTVAVTWTPVEGAGGTAILCSQPARYRKHGDAQLIVAAVNALPDLIGCVKVLRELEKKGEYQTCIICGRGMESTVYDPEPHHETCTIGNALARLDGGGK